MDREKEREREMREKREGRERESRSKGNRECCVYKCNCLNMLSHSYQTLNSLMISDLCGVMSALF